MTITWTTSTIGTVHYNVPEDRVMPTMEALIKLGFSPSVSIDTDA